MDGAEMAAHPFDKIPFLAPVEQGVDVRGLQPEIFPPRCNGVCHGLHLQIARDSVAPVPAKHVSRCLRPDLATGSKHIRSPP